MLFNIVKKSFLNQKKAFALMIVSVAVGTALAASLITISLEISGRVAKELRAFGANIVIEPKVEGLADLSGQKRYLQNEDIIKAKTIFWRHNIVGLVPFLKAKAMVRTENINEEMNISGTWYERALPVPGEEKIFTAGAKSVSPWWNIEGRWPASDKETAIGITLAERLGKKTGDYIRIDDREFSITGVLETGGSEDGLILMELEALQTLKGLQGKVSRIFVSALTKPMDEFAYRDPSTMSQMEYEKWYCTGYVTSIAKQLEEVFQGSKARPVWQIAETEGRILNRLKLLVYFLSCIAIAASALGVSTTMVMSSIRRVDEIGLMKAIGAGSGQIVAVFLSEAIMVGCIGGIAGYLLSIPVSDYIGMQVFNTALQVRSTLLPIALGSAVLIVIAGSVIPIRKALIIKPAVVLKGAR